MKKSLALLLVFTITFGVPSAGAKALSSHLLTSTAAWIQSEDWDIEFTADQLDNLVAPIALYPDPLLAQVLLAATFPDQIDEAARTIRAYGSGYDVDSAPWDVSVKAVSHYPTVLSMMADKLDWTTSLGQAYVNQSTDVMDAVQRLRNQARSAGYLVTTPQQEIVDEDGYVYIYPAQPEYIYVPVYDPAIVFLGRPGFHVGPVIWFGVGFAIGAWLNHDCDWRHHRVFYHGWEGGPRWIVRSRPHIRINNIYVNNDYRNVVVNRRVDDRRVNYGALNRYNSIHHDVDYNNVRRERNAGARPAPPATSAPRPDNKIIRRNMDPNDPRIDANRGHGQMPQPQPQIRQPETPRPEVRRPEIPQPQTRQPETPRPEARRPIPATTLPAQIPRTTQPQPQPQRQPNIQRQPESVFRGGAGMDSRAASERGQASRQQQSHPAPAARPAPPQNQPRGRGR